jgi:hypothetical protein
MAVGMQRIIEIKNHTTKVSSIRRTTPDDRPCEQKFQESENYDTKHATRPHPQTNVPENR